MNTVQAAFDPIVFLENAVQTVSNEDVAEMRALLVETLETHGCDVTVDSAGNTIATKTSDSPDAGPHLVLNTHIDTVSPHVPYGRDSDRILGRGSCDAKGPLAALLAAFIGTEPAVGRLTLAVTPDEETLSLGAAALTGKISHPNVEPIDGDLYIVGEPTNLDICTAAKGRFQGQLKLTGVNAHAAEPESGVNAISAVEDALGVISAFDDGREPHPQLGRATLTPTVIAGGDSTNQVPSHCTLTLDRRSIPPETEDEFSAAIEQAVRSAVDPTVGVEFTLTERESPFLAAFSTDPNHRLVETLTTVATDETGGNGGTVRSFDAATEASYFSPKPTVVFGPGVLADETGAVAHSEREYVNTADVKTAGKILLAAVRSLVTN